MEGLAFKYRNKLGAKVQINYDTPQYLFLEPYDKVVVRYYITKEGLEDSKTNVTRQAVDIGLISVKAKYTLNPLLTKISAFEGISNESIENTEIEFLEEDQEIFLDVLYESLTASRLRVKVRVFSEQNSSFENENTVSDGPDEYVRMTNVQIKFDAVYFTYIYRRGGRLQKFPGKASYEVLAQIYKDRRFLDTAHVDFEYPKRNIDSALDGAGWVVDSAAKEILKPSGVRYLPITDEELGKLIRERASVAEILGLLQTKDLQASKHILRRDAENFLVKCDKECSLPATTILNTIDTREN